MIFAWGGGTPEYAAIPPSKIFPSPLTKHNSGVFHTYLIPLFSFRPATDLLHDVCVGNRWGEPQYTLQVAPASPDGSLKMYIYKVKRRFLDYSNSIFCFFTIHPSFHPNRRFYYNGNVNFCDADNDSCYIF